MPQDLTPPICEKKPYEIVLHGDTISDEYYWLNGFFKKTADSDQVVEYLTAENNYTEAMMKHTEAFQVELYNEMKGRIKEKDESVPYFKNGYYYYTRTEEGQQYYKFYRKKGSLDGPEELLLDLDEMGRGLGYFSAVGFSVSPNNKLMAYGVDTVSRRQYTIHIKNLETGETLNDAIVNTSGNAAWADDNQTLFYTEKNPSTLLSEKIKRHKLGDDTANDAVMYHETDPSNYIGVYKSSSRKYIMIYSRATLSSEYRILEASNPNGEFKVFQSRIKDVLYTVDHSNDKFLIVTNQNAINFKLMQCPEDATTADNWQEVIAHREDVLLEDIHVFDNHWVIAERKDGLMHLRVRRLNDYNEHYLNFGEPAYMASIGVNEEANTTTLRYHYTSLTTPSSTYDYDMDSHDKKLMKQQEVLGGFDAADYVTERHFAPSRDGKRIPVSIVYHKDFKADGQAPLVLYGYGSYGNSIDATFSSARLSLLNRGFVYVIAHIRGGEEMGRQWYEDGKMHKKMNTFNDFIDCAEYLISKQYTSAAHLYGYGGSAGGLLMGAVANLRPDLWHGIIAKVPFVDVITTMLDESIPLTTNEFDEWGNPKKKEDYLYMKTYSPYDNIERKAYPHMLVTTGLHDSQVQYFEPAKWVARLRTHKTDNNLLLLKTNMEAGHGGASGRFDYLKEVALDYAFLLALENKVGG